MMATGNQISMKPIERVPLPEVVAQRILSLITEGRLKVGDKLPSQKELVEMLKVSRPSVREALSGMVMMGILEARAGQGYYLRKIPLDQKLDFSGYAPLANGDNIRHLFEARLTLESDLAAMAAERATDDDIARLYALVNEIEQKLPDTEALEMGITFHQLVAEAAHNPVLVHIESTLLSLFGEYVPRIFLDPPSYRRDVVTHLEIVERIADRDPEGARKAANGHLQAFANEIGVGDLWD